MKRLIGPILLCLAVFLVAVTRGEVCDPLPPLHDGFCGSYVRTSAMKLWLEIDDPDFPEFAFPEDECVPENKLDGDCWQFLGSHDQVSYTMQVHVLVAYTGALPTITWGELWGVLPSTLMIDSTSTPKIVRFESHATTDAAKDIQDALNATLQEDADPPTFYIGDVDGGTPIAAVPTTTTSVGLYLCPTPWEVQSRVFRRFYDDNIALLSGPPPGCNPDCYQVEKGTIAPGTFTHVKELYR